MTRALLVLALVIAPATARGDAQADKAKAVALFDDGIKNMKAGNYEKACKDLAASNALLPDTGTRGSLARCYAKLGKIATAWLLWRELADTAPSSDLRSDALVQATKLEARLSKYVVRVAAPSPGMVVKLEGRTIDTSSDVPTPIDAGRYKIEATAPDRAPWKTDIIIVEGKTATIEVPALVAIPTTKKIEKPIEKPIETKVTKRAGRGRTIAGIAIGVVGAGGIAVGGVFGVKARTLFDDAKKLCGGEIDHCAPGMLMASQAKVDDSRKAATISTIAFAGGGALVLTGIILVVTAPKTETRTVTVSPLLGEASAGLAVAGRF